MIDTDKLLLKKVKTLNEVVNNLNNDNFYHIERGQTYIMPLIVLMRLSLLEISKMIKNEQLLLNIENS